MTTLTNYSDIHNLLDKLQSAEGYELEFKESAESLPKSFWETYSSFANTSGGYIVLGVSEKKEKIIGVNNPMKIKNELFTSANNKNKVSTNILSNDDVIEYTINNKIIIVIHIRELPAGKKPLYLNGNPLNSYIRQNESDCKITEEDYRRFMRNAENNIDGELLDDYILDDLNPYSVLSFKNLMNNREPDKKFMEMDNLSFLKEMGIFRIDRHDNRKLKLTLAGLLFLGKLDAITQKVPHFHLDYINKRGVAINRWRDRVSTGDITYPDLNLFEFYRIVRGKLRLTVEDKFELDEKSVRKPSSELDKALREALANMIIHADYLDTKTSIKIVVENLYYTFLNPGAMKISKTQFFSGGHSEPRNNTLIQYFRRMGESERAGTGGKEILDIISKNKYRFPELTTNLEYTQLKLWCAIPAETYEDLSEFARVILEYFDKKINVKLSDIKNNTGLSEYYIRKAINELISKNLISCKGKGKATRYYQTPSMIETVDMANQLTEIIRNYPSVKNQPQDKE